MIKDEILYEGPNSIVVRIGNKVRKDIKCSNSMTWLPSPFELEIAHHVSHPYLLSGRGVIASADKVSLYLEKAEFDLIEICRFDLDIPRIVHIWYRISLGLLALHQNKIAHLDIKPENILLCRHQNQIVPKLADFGFCQDVTNDIFMTLPMGSLPYASPEMYQAALNHQSIYNSLQADIWSLGLTFYLLLSQDYAYIEVDLPLDQLIHKTEQRWLDGRGRLHLQSCLKDDRLIDLLAGMLVEVESRWTIQRVVSNLEEMVTREPHHEIVFSEVLSLPEEVQSIVETWMSRLNFSYIIQRSVYVWLRRFLFRLDPNIILQKEVMVVLVYLSLHYLGYRETIPQFITRLSVPFSVEYFIRLERDLLHHLHGQPEQND